MAVSRLILSLGLILLFSCSSEQILKIENTIVENNSNAVKPKGLYSSSFGNVSALDNGQVNGSLIRVKWSDIEPSEGQFDFSKIDDLLVEINARNLKWSLGVIAGGDSPDWLIDDLDADFFEITREEEATKRIPKIWDSKVNARLTILAQSLAAKYGNDTDLTLVYVPQMTANGIEGHFNGVSSTDLIDAGFTADKWVTAVKESAIAFANSFSTKAVAVEVHDIINDTSIPNRIMTDLWNNDELNQRVGAAIWWISGKTSYQPNLIEALSDFPGDIYAQAIGRSDQTDRFENGDYRTVFSQAKSIGVRYIELWEYEFVNNTYSSDFENYNEYASTSYE